MDLFAHIMHNDIGQNANRSIFGAIGNMKSAGITLGLLGWHCESGYQ